MIGVDKIGDIRRAYFEERCPSRRSSARCRVVARDGAQNQSGAPETEFKYEAWHPALAQVGRLGRGADGDSWRRKTACRGGSAARRSACSRSCAVAAMTAPTTACTGSVKPGALNTPRVPVRAFVPIELCARGSVSVRLEPRSDHAPRAAANGQGGAHEASHSRMPSCAVYSARPRSWCSTAHDKAFRFYGGVCRRGHLRQQKTAVEAIFRRPRPAGTIAASLQCLAHLVEPVACTPRLGWEKGQSKPSPDKSARPLFRPRPRRDEMPVIARARMRGRWEDRSAVRP